ncbi:hypothetical protein GCM10012289_28510 [Nonomuraea cavernae]|uniref:HTH gntR-type domain-containing protein n=1 Tax=Nonomuraea cavernae TaxID=2045107 RepID=A0A917YX81_9ACTN|nr:hypothetical protein GCM10012289_28510 [Nonomuraea cavernae]
MAASHCGRRYACAAGTGWIESQQGKGCFVRGRPAMASVEQKRPGQAYLIRPETDTTGEVVEMAS